MATEALSGGTPQIATTDDQPARRNLSRRRVLAGAGTAVAAALTPPVIAVQTADRPVAAVRPAERVSHRSEDARADHAFMVRMTAARAERARPALSHLANGDEERYATKMGSFGKGLPCNALGEVHPAAYQALLHALSSGHPAAFAAIPLGGPLPLDNPQAAYAFTLFGPDAQQLTLSPAPTASSAQVAAELAEDYWMALARDVPFAHYHSDPLIAQAAADLSAFSAVQGPTRSGAVTPATLFRGPTPGDLVGPYLSQFLWLDVPYGALTVAQRYPAATTTDFMTTYDDWLHCQRGGRPRARLAFAPIPRYLSCGRDLTTYVHSDFPIQAYLNAGLLLLRLGAPLDRSNPYRQMRTQRGFVTFGPPYVLDLVGRVASVALKAAWYQKWLVHRRVRPEALAGCVHKTRVGRAVYPLHPDLLRRSAVLDALFERYRSYLLPQAYPEGCPCHPSYPAAHAVVAGACVTVLKAVFAESSVLPHPVMASADGTRLIPYLGPVQLTVGGELNKLASNIALGRDMAGVHWRSDGMAGLELGEAVALGVLREERLTVHEPFGGFSVTTFGGRTVTA